MQQILKNLADIHRTGIVHRDVKPQNMILADNGILMIDLGAAADLRIGINYVPNEYLLDPRFAPPEQYIMSPLTPRHALPLVLADSATPAFCHRAVHQSDFASASASASAHLSPFTDVLPSTALATASLSVKVPVQRWPSRHPQACSELTRLLQTVSEACRSHGMCHKGMSAHGILASPMKWPHGSMHWGACVLAVSEPT